MITAEKKQGVLYQVGRSRKSTWTCLLRIEWNSVGREESVVWRCRTASTPADWDGMFPSFSHHSWNCSGLSTQALTLAREVLLSLIPTTAVAKKHPVNSVSTGVMYDNGTPGWLVE